MPNVANAASNIRTVTAFSVTSCTIAGRYASVGWLIHTGSPTATAVNASSPYTGACVPGASNAAGMGVEGIASAGEGGRALPLLAGLVKRPMGGDFTGTGTAIDGI